MAARFSQPIQGEASLGLGQRSGGATPGPQCNAHSSLAQTRVTGIYAAAEISVFPGNGAPTAIFKKPVSKVKIDREGILGDYQADRRVHGGPEKAVHHYAVTNYAKLAVRFPEIAAVLVPGSIGENLSALGIDETSVAIGDIFAFGSARLQVCQPRSPCWKIDARYGITGAGKYISDYCCQGWYYRVLEGGEAAVGNELILLERNADPVFIAEFWTGWRERPPNAGKLGRFLSTPGLASVWQRYLTERLAFLRDQSPASAPEVPAVHARRD